MVEMRPILNQRKIRFTVIVSKHQKLGSIKSELKFYDDNLAISTIATRRR